MLLQAGLKPYEEPVWQYFACLLTQLSGAYTHCCRLQAIYSPITGKNFVTVYIPIIVLKSVIPIVDYLYFTGQILL